VTSTGRYWIGDEYWSFQIGAENDKYRLELGGYSGDAGDALMHEGDQNGDGYFGDYLHNGMKFTTYDDDNDENNANCAATGGGAWWYNSCFHVCLTCYSDKSEWNSLPGNIFIVNSRMLIKPQ